MTLSLPYIPFFSFFLILGPIISLSSSNWLLIWLGLEINLMSFIPLLSSTKSLQETEASTKYFLTQACAGLILLWGLLSNSILSMPLISISLLLKMGAAPTHFWLPSVMSSLPWTQAMILATWQKLAPISILFYLPSSTNLLIFLFAIISALTGGIMGLNQTQLRTIMAYSSINHLGWMLMASLLSPPLALIYFIVYSSMTLAAMTLFHFLNLYSITYLFFYTHRLFATLMFLLFFSLAGIPPLTGFAPKALILYTLISHNLTPIAIILLISSLMSLYYYLSVATSSLPKSASPKSTPSIQLSLSSSTLILLATTSIPVLIAPLL